MFENCSSKSKGKISSKWDRNWNKSSESSKRNWNRIGLRPNVSDFITRTNQFFQSTWPEHIINRQWSYDSYVYMIRWDRTTNRTKTIRMEFETFLKPKLKVVNLNYVYRTRTEYTLILDLHKQDLHHIIEVRSKCKYDRKSGN